MSHKFFCDYASPSKSFESLNYEYTCECCNCAGHIKSKSEYGYKLNGAQNKDIKAETCLHEPRQHLARETKDEGTDANGSNNYYYGPAKVFDRNIEEVTIAQTKPVVRKRVHKIYLPEIDTKQVGQSLTEIQLTGPSVKNDEAVNTDLRTKPAKPLSDVKNIGVGRNCECVEVRKCEDHDCEGIIRTPNIENPDKCITPNLQDIPDIIKDSPSETLKSYFNKDIVDVVGSSNSLSCDDSPNSDPFLGIQGIDLVLSASSIKILETPSLIQPQRVEVSESLEYVDQDTLNEDSDIRNRDLEKINLSIQNLRREICRIDDTDLKDQKSEFVQVHLSQVGPQAWIVLEEKQQYKYQTWPKNDRNRTKKCPSRTKRKDIWILKKTKNIFHKLELVLQLVSKHLNNCHKAQPSNQVKAGHHRRREGPVSSKNLMLQLSKEQICNIIEYESSYLLYKSDPKIKFKNEIYRRQSKSRSSRTNQRQRSNHSKRSHKSNQSKRSVKSSSSNKSSLSQKSSCHWPQSREKIHFEYKGIRATHKNRYKHVNTMAVSYPRYCGYRTKHHVFLNRGKAFGRSLSNTTEFLRLHGTASCLEENVCSTSTRHNCIRISESCVDSSSYSDANLNPHKFIKRAESLQQYSSNSDEFFDSKTALDICATEGILKSLLYIPIRSRNLRSEKLIVTVIDERKVQFCSNKAQGLTANETTECNLKENDKSVSKLNDVCTETNHASISSNSEVKDGEVSVGQDNEAGYDKELYDTLVLSQKPIEKNILNPNKNRCRCKEMAINILQCSETENVDNFCSPNGATVMRISNVVNFANNVSEISELFPEYYCFR